MFTPEPKTNVALTRSEIHKLRDAIEQAQQNYTKEVRSRKNAGPHNARHRQDIRDRVTELSSMGKYLRNALLFGEFK